MPLHGVGLTSEPWWGTEIQASRDCNDTLEWECRREVAGVNSRLADDQDRSAETTAIASTIALVWVFLPEEEGTWWGGKRTSLQQPTRGGEVSPGPSSINHRFLKLRQPLLRPTTRRAL